MSSCAVRRPASAACGAVGCAEGEHSQGERHVGHRSMLPSWICTSQCLVRCGMSVSTKPFTYSPRLQVYCPRCKDIFYPRSSSNGRIDGAYFTTTVPALFLFIYFTTTVPGLSDKIHCLWRLYECFELCSCHICCS